MYRSVSATYLTTYSLSACAPGIPKLHKLQQTFKEQKRSKVACIRITSRLELQHFTVPLLMPPSLSMLSLAPTVGSSALTDVCKNRVVCVPQDNVYSTTGVCLTGPMQIEWMKQLTTQSYNFILHADGKHKLHHGGWILMTVGTHVLHWDAHHHSLSHKFIPLMYLFCQDHESNGACLMLVDALNIVCLKYHGTKLYPGGTCADHSDGFRHGFTTAFPDAPFGQCWPHIIGKWKKGEYASKTWAHFDTVAGQLLCMHLTITDEMRDLVMAEVGELWDSWPGGQMNTFWNSYCMGGWDNWHMGVFPSALATPNQNCQESWHKQLAISRIPSMFRASTEMLFKEGLPALIERDAILLPTKLNFGVPAIPAGTMKKALWYIEHQETHILEARDNDGEKMWYVLRRDNDSGYKKIEKRLIEMFEAAMQGEKDRRVKDLDHLLDVCRLFHIVEQPDALYFPPPCDGNPLQLMCKGCKGYQHSGICSHLLTVNHIEKQFNVRAQLVTIGKSTGKTTGGKAKAPALMRLPQRAADSSDEEDERQLQLGMAGQ